mmetsp:Transcript_94984/g.307268  ORF Transcript_94984/g.307268 Transcript_94984/m.307268 type:complete len:144 (+) Transcript_94984:229-660(+)
MLFRCLPRRSFYETTFSLHHKFPANDCKLLLRETTRTIAEKDGAIFRILDLGWRHTAQPVNKSGVGQFHYCRWYVMSWGGPPLVVKELNETLKYSTGVLRYMTVKIRGPKDVYRNRSTFYPVLKPSQRIAPPLMHHTAMNEVR